MPTPRASPYPTKRSNKHITRISRPISLIFNHHHSQLYIYYNYGRLLQSYGVHKTIREARLRGLRSTRRVEADGSILLTLEGGAL